MEEPSSLEQGFEGFVSLFVILFAFFVCDSYAIVELYVSSKIAEQKCGKDY
jgi:hypothetical protein